MEIVDFYNRNDAAQLEMLSKRQSIAQTAQYLDSAKKYSADPSAQNLQAVGLANPAAANTMMAIKKQQAEESAKEVRSIYNTWKSVPPSKKPEFFTEIRKKFGDKMRFYPVEYNPNDPRSVEEINKMLEADNMTAMGLLGENAQSSIGKIRADMKQGLISEEDAKSAINKERNGDTPSSIKEYNFYSKLSPADQQKYLDIKRDTKGIVLNPDGTVSTKGGYTDAKRDIKEAEGFGAASGKVKGEDAANAQINLPKVQDQANYAIKLLDNLVKHPGLKDVVGLKESSGIPMIAGLKPVAGTKAADFMARFEQIQGQKFLEAYQMLKGGGAITEIEGEKATQAISRIKTAQSEKEFLEAVKELKDIVNKGLERAREKAGNSQNKISNTSTPEAKDKAYFNNKYGLVD